MLPRAPHNASACEYAVIGCTDPSARDYLVAATVAGACEFPRFGCTVALHTLNYDSTATVLAGCHSLLAIAGAFDALLPAKPKENGDFDPDTAAEMSTQLMKTNRTCICIQQRRRAMKDRQK